MCALVYSIPDSPGSNGLWVAIVSSIMRELGVTNEDMKAATKAGTPYDKGKEGYAIGWKKVRARRSHLAAHLSAGYFPPLQHQERPPAPARPLSHACRT